MNDDIQGLCNVLMLVAGIISPFLCLVLIHLAIAWKRGELK